jgi:hypothetical protein
MPHSPSDPENKIRIQIRTDTREADALSDRAMRLKPSGPPLRLDPLTSAVQFLRGVSSRATLSLPAFYLFLGSSVEGREPCSVPAYPGIVLTHWVRFSSINTITLSCRKAFDHAATGLTGAVFAKTSDSVLHAVADYWAKSSGRPVDEALSALVLLRAVFGTCSRTSAVLLNSESTLGKRVGLLKQHADRTAAHLSLESYEFSQVDCAHVVAALTLIGEVIRTFDDASSGPDYYNGLDQAALAAAKAIFPKTPDLRLFGHINIARQAQWCWKHDHAVGQQMLLERLPYAIGWY